MCPLENSFEKYVNERKKEEKTPLISFIVYFSGLGVVVTKQLQVSLNILLPLIHDVSCFINVTFSVLGMHKEALSL